MDKTACPLCGGPNECGMAAGAGSCWCFETSIPRDVLAQVAADVQGDVCVCQRCATRPDEAVPDAESST